jgi:hypothetical protein
VDLGGFMENEIPISASFYILLNKILDKLTDNNELIAEFQDISIKYVCDDEQERQIFEVTRRVKND